MKHHIVCIDGWMKLQPLNFDYDLTQYTETDVADLPSRVKDATIMVTSATKVTRAGIENAPNLQLVSCNGVGTDHIDKDALREHGVTLCHVPAQNKDSVSEHAFALYYAVRRRILPMQELTLDGGIWASEKAVFKRMGPPTRTNAEETLVVVGYGTLGQNVESIGKALGMNVLIAERKGATTTREGRVSFEDALEKGTFFVLVTPLDDSTKDLIDAAEFAAMQSSAIVVNVGRGGVINEAALAKALREGQISGAGTDVFEHEPATKENCPLLDPTIPNLVLTPHVAWYSTRTIQGTVATVKANIEGFVAGKPQNIIVAGNRSF